MRETELTLFSSKKSGSSAVDENTPKRSDAETETAADEGGTAELKG